MADFRIPTAWLQEITEALEEHPDVGEMTFVSDGGNVLLARRRRWAPHSDLPEDADYWDFTHNLTIDLE